MSGGWLLRLVGLLLIGVLGAQIVTAQGESLSAGELLAQANRAYIDGDYDTAIALYETLIAEGVSHGAVYFNLGTAYDQVGQPGRALLNYLRAQRVSPRDMDVSARIAAIQGARQDVQSEETVIIDRLGTMISGVVTMGELAVTGFILWTLWFGLATISVMRPSGRNTLRPLLIVFGVLAAAAVVLVGSRVYIEVYRPAAVVTAEQAVVLSGPAERYLELFELSEAAELRVVARAEGWGRIVLPDGRRGWLQMTDVGLVGRP